MSPEGTLLRKTVEYLFLLGIAGQLASFLTLQEIQVYLSVIVGQLALTRMPIETGEGSEQEAPDAPVHRCERDRLVPHA